MSCKIFLHHGSKFCLMIITEVSFEFYLGKVCFYTIADLITLILLGFEDTYLFGNQSNCFHNFAAYINSVFLTVSPMLRVWFL